jgi:hypothetical protein
MTICLVDTSIFCNLLEVPGRCQDKQAVLAALEQKIHDRWSLLLPLSAILETGNHIAHCANGAKRRSAAERFVRQVRMAMEGDAPWVVTPIPDNRDWLTWLDDFPDSAMREVSIADLTIIKEYERQCALNPARRVMVWSLDDDLNAYDRVP